MKRRQFIAGTFGLGASTATASVFKRPAHQEGSLPKAGYAEADITPDPGMEQPGGYGKAYLNEVHDPCKVRAAVFDDGATRVALVGLDARGVPEALVASARKLIRERCGIEETAILIGASHSHSSGPAGSSGIGVQPWSYGNVPAELS